MRISEASIFKVIFIYRVWKNRTKISHSIWKSPFIKVFERCRKTFFKKFSDKKRSHNGGTKIYNGSPSAKSVAGGAVCDIGWHFAIGFIGFAGFCFISVSDIGCSSRSHALHCDVLRLFWGTAAGRDLWDCGRGFDWINGFVWNHTAPAILSVLRLSDRALCPCNNTEAVFGFYGIFWSVAFVARCCNIVVCMSQLSKHQSSCFAPIHAPARAFVDRGTGMRALLPLNAVLRLFGEGVSEKKINVLRLYSYKLFQ